MSRPEHGSNVQILNHIEEAHLDAALTILYDAFAEKFRHGFRSADDLVRCFRNEIDRRHCFTALIDGELLGIVTYRTGKPRPRDFYKMNLKALLTGFNPLRVLLILFNIMLLTESVQPREFLVESIAVDPRARGLGLGTKLMNAAEQEARADEYPIISLSVIGENPGAIRLYERLGYRIAGTQSGFWVRLASDQETVHRMEKPLLADG